MNRILLATALALAAGLLSSPALANIPVPGDYNGDGIDDLVEWRPQDGIWFGVALDHTGGVSHMLPFHGQQQWGAPTDIPVPGDYDGNGTTDIAVWRPSNGEWYVKATNHAGEVVGNLPLTGAQWGAPTDIPVPGDYDGNGTTDIAVWRPSNGHWYVKGTNHAGEVVGDLPLMGTQWGAPTDIPVPGDYDGNGTTDIAVWRPGTGYWYAKATDHQGAITGHLPLTSGTQWGDPTDIPVPADYDGNGTTDIAVWRPSVGHWYAKATDHQGAVVGNLPLTGTSLGAPSDVPAPADYNGDGTADMVVRRPGSGQWFGLATDGDGANAGIMPLNGHVVGVLNDLALKALEARVDGAPVSLDALVDLPLGATLELSWAVRNAYLGSCGLEPRDMSFDAIGIDAGAAQRVLSRDEHFTLYCDHPSQGPAVAVAAVSVQVRPPSITAFTVAPAPADAGAPLTVNWASSDATDCALTHGAQMLDGAFGTDEHLDFVPGQPVELRCENAATGRQVSRVEQIALEDLAVDRLEAYVDNVLTPLGALVDLRRGSTVELSWGVRNAYLGACALAPVQPALGAIGTDVGRAAHVVSQDARLSLYCAHLTQGRNVAVAEVPITVEPPPSVTILAPESRPHFLPDSGEIAVTYEAVTVVDCRLDSSGAAPTVSNTVVAGNRILGDGVVPFTEAITITVTCRDRDGAEHRDEVQLTIKETGFDVTDLEVEGNPLGYVIENDNVNDAPRPELARVLGDLFGMSLAVLGDLNADGAVDVAVGAPGFDETNGRIFLMDGGRRSGVHALSGLAATDYRGSALPPLRNPVHPRLLRHFFAPEITFGATAPRERLGTEMQRGGDINGDGHPDLIVGSPYGSASRPHTQGTVYVVFGGPDLDPAMPLSALELPGNGRGFAIFGTHAHTYGNSNAGIGSSFAGYRTLGDLDVNGDGLQDVVVGAPNERPSGNVYVVFGKRDDAPVELADLAVAGSGQGFLIDNRVTFPIAGPGYMGGLLSHAGDLNADGLDDISLAIGGSYSPPKGAYVVHGKTDDAPIVVTAGADSEHIQWIEGSISGNIFGSLWGDLVGVKENSGGYDVNGDGRSDLVVSSMRHRGARTSTAEYLVFFGADDPSHRYDPARLEAGDPSGFSIRAPYFTPWTEAGEIAERDSIRLIDDINGDGLADIVISMSVPFTDFGAWEEGRIWVVYGKSDPAPVDLLDVANGIGGFVIRNEDARRGFADRLSTRGDIDGDGLSDLLFGSYEHPGVSFNSGRAYVFYGGDHSSSINFYGDDGDDAYVAASADARIVGGRGDDVLTSAGGAAVIYGGAGDDRLTVTDAGFRRVKGGAGTDTLIIDTDEALDLDALSRRIAGIERIELPDARASVAIGRRALQRLSDTSNTVVFAGGAAVSLHGDGWVLDGSVDGHQRFVNGNAVALVQDGIDLNTPPAIETSALALDENSGADVAVGDIVVVDVQGDAFGLVIVGGTGRDAFYVNGTTLLVDGSVAFDFEAGIRTWSLQFEATDAHGLVGTADVIVSITDINEPPTLALPARIDLDEGAMEAPGSPPPWAPIPTTGRCSRMPSSPATRSMRSPSTRSPACSPSRTTAPSTSSGRPSSGSRSRSTTTAG